MTKKKSNKKKPEEEGYCDPKCAEAKVPSYITPRCLFWHINNEVGYGPIGGTPCAHYVAGAKKITISRGVRCYNDHPIRVGQVVQYFLGKGWEMRTSEDPLGKLHKVRKGDIWARLNPDGVSGHCGYVVDVTPGRKPVIRVSHHPQSAAPTTVTYGTSKSVRGGEFYGPKLPKTRWLGNCNPTDPKRKFEFHDLKKEKKNCQIDEIKCKVHFSSKKEALDYGYDPCAYCKPGKSTR